MVLLFPNKSVIAYIYLSGMSMSGQNEAWIIFIAFSPITNDRYHGVTSKVDVCHLGKLPEN